MDSKVFTISKSSGGIQTSAKDVCIKQVFANKTAETLATSGHQQENNKK